MVSFNFCGVLSAILFTIGAAGVLSRRNAIIVFMSIEIMLNAVNLAFVTFSKLHGGLDGQIFVFFVMTVAAAEAAVGLALIVAVYRHIRSVDVSLIDRMKG